MQKFHTHNSEIKLGKDIYFIYPICSSRTHVVEYIIFDSVNNTMAQCYHNRAPTQNIAWYKGGEAKNGRALRLTITFTEMSLTRDHYRAKRHHCEDHRTPK
jgi:hypothetical protein